MSNKKIIIIVAILLLVVYLFWHSFKKPAPKQEIISGTVNGGANVQPAKPVYDDSFPLKDGSRGDNVLRLQKALNVINASHPFNNKYTPLVTDGVYGNATYTAVLLLVGTAFVPVTQIKWNEIVSRANNLQASK